MRFNEKIERGQIKLTEPEIGSIHEMTRSEAKRWLSGYIDEQGVNSSAHLARSQSPNVSFGDAAELWRQRQLIACGKPSSRSSMGCELRKHVVPLLKETPLDEVNDYSLIRDLIATWQEEEREDGEVGYSYKYIKNLFGHIRAVYNFYRDETAQKGKPKIGEWFVKWERVAPPEPIEVEQPHFSTSVTSAIVGKARTQMQRALFATAGGGAPRGGELFGLHVEDVREQDNGTAVICIRRSVFTGQENSTKSEKIRHVPIDASVMEEVKKHLAETNLWLCFSNPQRNSSQPEQCAGGLAPSHLGRAGNSSNGNARLSKRSNLRMGVQRCEAVRSSVIGLGTEATS